MKKVFLFLAVALVAASCGTPYLQLATVASNDKAAMGSEEALMFNEEVISVSYDFWSPTGNVVFAIRNNTDKAIYVDLSKSFFVMNGQANDYFKNRTWISTRGFASSKKAAVSKGITAAMGQYQLNLFPGASVDVAPSASATVGMASTSMSSSSVETKEKEGEWIPAHASKVFGEYNVMDGPYRECGFNRFPSNREESFLDFSESNSPYVFSNSLVIVIDGQERTYENNFYVSHFQNYRASDVVVMERNTDCSGKKLSSYTEYVKGSSANEFYNRYTKRGKASDDKLSRAATKASAPAAKAKKSKK